jgi:hypothetical protein
MSIILKQESIRKKQNKKFWINFYLAMSCQKLYEIHCNNEDELKNVQQKHNLNNLKIKIN